MDYDATDIPVVYDKARALSSGVQQLWLSTVARYVGERCLPCILDLGCGTGRFTQALADYFDADTVGADPSCKMLEQARAKQRSTRIRYEHATGEMLPLPDASVGLVFMSMVFHHFLDPHQVARECRRVTQRSGLIFLRNGTRDGIASYPFLGFFPESRPILQKRLPTCSYIREVFETAGFRTVDAAALNNQLAPTYADYADKIAAGGDSILAELSAEDFTRGLSALRRHAARVDPQPVRQPIDYFVFE